MEKFIVSARKYRPATFASVVGQSHITSTLKNAIERGQLAHAYLFCGPRGVGKTTCARIFAKAINCLSPNGAEACDRCDSCLSFNENRSLNIHELDAASNNSVDDIRNLIDQVRVLPQIGRYSVFIIDEVHMLSAAAFNAFLKTLEEPPQHAIFILATTEKHKIIPTILSRCQIYDFNRIRVEDAVGYLRYIAESEGVTADEESLNLIAQKADGGMRDALSMFDKAVSFCGAHLEYKAVAATLNILDYETYFRFTDMLLQGDYVNALIEYDNVLTKGFSGQTFMGGLNQHFRDLMMARGAGISLIEYTGSLLERYRTQASQCDGAFLFGAISLLTEADSKLRTATSQRLLVELTLMKIAALGQKKNDDLEPWEQPSYSLPNLDEKPTAIVSEQPSVAPSPTPQVVEPTPIPQPTEAPTLQPAVAQPQPTEAPASQPAVAQPQPTEAPTPQPAVAQPQPTEAPASKQSSKSKTSRLGSLHEIMERASTPVKGGAGVLGSDIDPKSEDKLFEAKEQIIKRLSENGARFASTFERMDFRENKLLLVVPTESLRDELIDMRFDILKAVAQEAHIVGALEMVIEIKEVEYKLKPVKLEDRIEYMYNTVPELGYLQKSLDIVFD